MQNRLITGFIMIFLALALGDVFLDTNAEPSLSADRLGSALAIGSQVPLIATSETRVIRVIDGDTIVVLINGIQEKVRLIGVDTPETVDPRGSAQCFGIEASGFTKSLLENQVVRLETDASQDDRDKYGRLLRYVFLNDSTFVNKEIITQGYGHEYTYRTPYKYQADFKNAELSAQNSKIGLWAEGVCKNI